MRDTPLLFFLLKGEGALHLGPERARVFADLSAEQKDRYKADIRATNILLQGTIVLECSVQKYPTQSLRPLQSSINHQIADNFQLDTEARQLKTFQDGRVVVQDVRGKYNANNQGRPFQRNTARGNVVTGNAGGQNRDEKCESGSSKPIMCYHSKESAT
ncbi:hypothetical protein Tco_0227283 [Tanacetum coccineum]